MSYYLNQGNEKFMRYTNNEIFIDKSLLIKETNNFIGKASKKYMCITRPRRFGKTMALSMLNAYYSKGCDSKELFKKLKVSNVPSFDAHLNKHNVIWIDMASLYSNLKNKEEYIDRLQERVIDDLNDSFPNILTSKENTIADSLMKIYDVTKETFIFLIDEWDVVLRESNDENQKFNYIQLLRSLFKSSDTSSCIDLVYMTGILPIKRYKKKESDLNNFKEYTMLKSKPISEFIGFTKYEVISLCDEHNMDFNEMKRWYDGYNIDSVEIYNPKSVVEAITQEQFDNYWVSTSSLESALDYLRYKDNALKIKIMNMLADNSVSVSVRSFNNDISILNCADDVLTLLIHLGYLTYKSDTKECYIPNYEIRCELELAFEKLDDNDLYESIKDSESAVNALYNKNEDLISKVLDKNHEIYESCLNKNNEQVLELLTIFSFSTLKSTHTIKKEPQNIKGRADIIYIPKENDPAIIVELKYNKNASLAIEQIKNKEYISLLDNYHGKVILCGINYDDNMKHQTKIEEIEI